MRKPELPKVGDKCLIFDNGHTYKCVVISVRQNQQKRYVYSCADTVKNKLFPNFPVEDYHAAEQSV